MRIFSFWSIAGLMLVAPMLYAQTSTSQRATELYRAGEYQEAIREFRLGIQSGEISNIRGRYLIALTQIKMKEYRKAELQLRSLQKKKLSAKMKKKVQKQLRRIRRLKSKEQNQDQLEERISLAMQEYDVGKLSTALDNFEEIQKTYADQTSRFMLGVIHYQLGEVELGEEYFEQVTDKRYIEDIEFIRGNDTGQSSKRFSFSLTYKRGANSNPVLDNEFSEINASGNDTENQVQVDARYVIYRSEKDSQLRLDASFYSEDYSFNDDVDNQNIDFGLQWTQWLGDVELSLAPMYSKQKQDAADMLASYALYMDFSLLSGASNEWTLGLSYTHNDAATNFEYLEGSSYSVYAGYMRYWTSAFASLTLQYFKSDLSDEEDLIVSNSGWGVSTSYILISGKWTFPFSVKYLRKTYIEDTSLSFLRQDSTISLSVNAQYQLTSYFDVFVEAEFSKNNSNQEDDSDNRNYRQARALLGLTLSY